MIRNRQIVRFGHKKELSEALLSGMRVTLSLRVGQAGAARASQLIASVEGVTQVELAAPAAEGPGVASYRVALSRETPATS